MSCGFLLGVADDVDACMDGPAFDGTRVAPNSLIQSFTEYHDNSCARLTALQNSRTERGHHVRGGIERPSTGSLCKVRQSAGKKRALSQQQPVKVHDETWAGGQEILRLTISQADEIQPSCAASVFPPSGFSSHSRATWAEQ